MSETKDIRRKPAEWCVLLGWDILDPDGWRSDHGAGVSWEVPISEAEFVRRANESTHRRVEGLAWDVTEPGAGDADRVDTQPEEAGEARLTWHRLVEAMSTALGCDVLAWRDHETGEWSATCQTCGAEVNEDGCTFAQKLATAADQLLRPAPEVQPTEEARPWLPVEFAGYDSTSHPLFRLNGGRTEHAFSREDLRDAFLGMLPPDRVDSTGYIKAVRDLGLCGYPLGGANPGTCREPAGHDYPPNRTDHVSDGSRS